MFVLDCLKTYAKTGRTALINRGESLTFAQLDARSESFATWLLEQFGDDRTPVVLYGHKQTDLLPCIYGALKSGRGYVPVDLVTPPHRAAEILADIRPKAVVNLSGVELPAVDAAVLGADALRSVLDTAPTAQISRDTWIAGSDIAYLLFTSGSTGKPKGVPITADNLACFHSGLLPYLDGDGGGVILNQVSYSFDVSCCSLYTGLSLGMSLFTVDKELAENLGALFALLRESGLTTWVSTPSFAELCVGSRSFDRELLPELRRFLFCGEVLTHKLCDTLAERFPGARVLNTYGPTEATVLVTAAEVTEDLRRAPLSIPIGRPLQGVELRLTDEAGNALEGDDACGELLILGRSVGPGYHLRPELTAERFFTDDLTGLRGYRTGDLCRRKNGLYYYQGRADNQMKLNGYRVELEDIEHNLAALPNIARAAVVPVWADAEHSRVKYLTAFLLLEEEDGLSPLKRSIRIKRQAAEALPPYMIPRKFLTVDAFPLGQSGKIDRAALAERLEEAVLT